MDTDLRRLLRDKADEVRPSPAIPPEVLGRARRRRVATAALAGAVTVGVALGGFVGARALLDQMTSAPTDLRPGQTTEKFYPFIYPPTQEELEVTQEQVAQGSMPLWTDPEGVAILFAVNVMGWEMDDVEASVRGDEPITVVITNPALNDAAGATADLRTTVHLARVPGSDPSMFAVLAAQAEAMELEPVGPDDEFGTDGRIAFGGQVSYVPQGGSVLLSVDGRPGAPVLVTADRPFRVTADLPSGPGPSTLLSVALLDRGGRTLTMTSSRLGSPIVHGFETGASTPQLAVPPPVAATRDAILDAARARDFEALRTLIPDEGFTFSFGGETDPIRYWKRLESEGHQPVIGDILPAVLGTEPGYRRGVFVWPAQALEEPARWDEADIEVLSAIHAKEDVRAFQDAGLYYGWRVGIDRDGTWVFFVAGD